MSDRRIFLKSLSSLPLSVVLANPRISQAVSAGLQELEAKLSDGRTVKGALAEPQGQSEGSILLVHEWWGLNDQIKSVASEFANQGYTALAVDLYHGKVAGTGDHARSQRCVERPSATEAPSDGGELASGPCILTQPFHPNSERLGGNIRIDGLHQATRMVAGAGHFSMI